MKNHMSEPLSESDFDDRTLVLTISAGEKEQLLGDFKDPVNVFSLTEYIGGDQETEDPYGGTLGSYGKCFEQLSAQIGRLADILKTEEEG